MSVVFASAFAVASVTSGARLFETTTFASAGGGGASLFAVVPNFGNAGDGGVGGGAGVDLPAFDGSGGGGFDWSGGGGTLPGALPGDGGATPVEVG